MTEESQAEVQPEAAEAVEVVAEETAPTSIFPEQTAEEKDVDDVQHPEWFMKDKYSSIEEQAKAYSELNSKTGGNWGAPKGDYVLSEDSGVPQNDPMLSHMQTELKEIGLSNQGFNKLLKSYWSAADKVVQNEAQEVAKTLHKEQASMVTQVDKQLNQLLGNEEAHRVKGLIRTVEDFQSISKLLAHVPTSSNIPSQSHGMPVAFESVNDIEKEKGDNNDRYKKDQTYRRELSAREVQARQRAGQ